MLLTQRGICYNLELTPYSVIINYPNDEKVQYNFSSQYYVNMFNDKLVENRIKINDALSKRYNIKIINNKLADINLYSKVEKRGFYIINKEGVYKCLNSIKLDGQNKMLKI